MYPIAACGVRRPNWPEEVDREESLKHRPVNPSRNQQFGVVPGSLANGANATASFLFFQKSKSARKNISRRPLRCLPASGVEGPWQNRNWIEYFVASVKW